MGALLGLLALLLAPRPAAAQVIEYYHLDAIGNIRAITDQSGNVIERHDYLPFGEECTAPPCTPLQGDNTKKFTGKERDQETGLDYFGARYYRGNAARFTTVDPAMNATLGLYDPQKWNRYAYGRNNPFRYVDPDGRELRLAGNPNSAVAALQSTVPAADRGYIRAAEQNGQVMIDARAINEGASSKSENFLAIRQIANSPGIVDLDASSPTFVVRTSKGDETVAFSPGIHGYTETGTRPIRVNVNPDEGRSDQAASTAHELRHARRQLLGQPAAHEYLDTNKTLPNPSGSVNLETKAGADEARRNSREPQ